MVFSGGHILECGFRGPGNEGLPATRASRQPGSPGNEGLPATRASRQRGPPGNEGFRQRGLPRLWLFSGGHILEKGPPRDRPRMCSKSFILWQNLSWQNPASIFRIQVLTGKPLTGGPLREHPLRGRPSLTGPLREGVALTGALTGQAPYEAPLREDPLQRGPPSNEGLPATRAASRQRGPPGNEATRASRQRGPHFVVLLCEGLLKASKAYVSLFYEGPRPWGCWTNF